MKYLQCAAVLLASVFLLLYDSAEAQQAELAVSPTEGPIGTTVLIEGRGCNNPGQGTFLAFQNGDETTSATVGADLVGSDIPTDGQGRFSVTYTVPREFASGSLQGRGGGPLTPGVYQFTSRPVICQVSFTLTAPPQLPETGGPVGEASESPPSLWLLGISAIFGAASATGGLLMASRRSSYWARSSSSDRGGPPAR
jgi:hypothetical protein